MYRTIDSKFWSDPKVKKLTPDTKLLFLYFVTNPHVHVSGIYYLPMVTVAQETGLSSRGLDTLCDTLSSLGLVRFDRENDIVWVVNMMSYQGRGDKHLRSAAYHVVEDLHNSFLVHEFLEKYPKVSALVGDRVTIGYQDGIQRKDDDAPPESRYLIPETREQIPNKPSAKKPSDLPVDEQFEEFWKVYPSIRKEGKREARTAWEKAKKLTSPEVLIAAAKEYAASPVGQGQFAKGPSPWLNQGCWEDDRTAWNRRDTQNGRPAKLLDTY